MSMGASQCSSETVFVNYVLIFTIMMIILMILIFNIDYHRSNNIPILLDSLTAALKGGLAITGAF